MLDVKTPAVLLALVLVACGGDASSKSRATDAVGPAAATPLLHLAEVTAYGPGDRPGFKLHADGSTEILTTTSEVGGKEPIEERWIPGPTFRADGTVLIDGQPKAKLTPAGIVLIGTDRVLPFVVEGNKVSFARADKPISFSLKPDGTIAIVGIDTRGMTPRLVGPSAEALHTGLVVLTASMALKVSEELNPVNSPIE